MTEEKPSEKKENNKEPSEAVLLAEYQACKQDNAATFQGFWTLAAIFIGLSSAFLAGLIYAVIANKSLLSILLFHNRQGETFVISITALIIGIANVFILKNIKGWRTRVQFNQTVINGRMREIELQLGMSYSWRIYAIDRWYEIVKSDNRKKCNDQKWDKLKEKLEKDLTEKYRPKLDDLESEILELLKQYFTEKGKVREINGKYEPWSSTKHFPNILRTLMVLWSLVIVTAVFEGVAAATAGILWGIVTVLVLAVGGVILWIIIRRARKRRSKHLDH